MVDYLQVGVITSTHGLKGEVKVFPTTDDPARFRKLEEVILEGKRERRVLTVESVRFFKQMVIMKFKGLDRIEDVEQWGKCPLLVPRAQAVELGPNENFIADMIGLRTYTDEGQFLGTLSEVLQTGANDVYIVKNQEGKEILLPAIPACILSVDVEKGEMVVHLMEGILDL